MDFCCKDMEYHICEARDSEMNAIWYIPKFNEYGIPCKEDGVSMITIDYCPWCGKKLPDSLRDKWFAALFALGFEDPLFDKNVPKEYQTDLWWRKQEKQGTIV